MSRPGYLPWCVDHQEDERCRSRSFSVADKVSGWFDTDETGVPLTDGTGVKLRIEGDMDALGDNGIRAFLYFLEVLLIEVDPPREHMAPTFV